MPSKQHTELTRRALIWLSNISTQKGIRSCPEIILGEGYVADAGAILNLQSKWDYRFFNGSPYFTLKEKNGWENIDDFSFVIESKAFRSDFLKTFINSNHIGDRLKPVANFHFVVVAKGIIKPEEIPSFWGCLEESRHGLKLVKNPTYCTQPIQSLHEFAYRILRLSDWRKFRIIDLKEEIIMEEQSTFDL